VSKKDKRIAELEDEVARLQAELIVASASAHTIVTAPCSRPHSDEYPPFSPYTPYTPYTPYRIWNWC
jgi:hypothetical protein